MINPTNWLNTLTKDIEVFVFLYQESNQESPTVSHLLLTFEIDSWTLWRVTERSELLELVNDYDLRDYRVRNNLT